MAVFVVAMILGGAASTLVAFALYLAFCVFVVIRTGGTSGLRDVAIAIRAFAGLRSLSPLSRLKSEAMVSAAELDKTDGLDGEILPTVLATDQSNRLEDPLGMRD